MAAGRYGDARTGSKSYPGAESSMPHRWFSQSGSDRSISPQASVPPHTCLTPGRRLRVSLLRHRLGVPIIPVLRPHSPDRTGHSIGQGDCCHAFWFSCKKAFKPGILLTPKRLAAVMTDMAPRIKWLRVSTCRIFDTFLRRLLLPVEFCPSISPSQAEKTRPGMKHVRSGAKGQDD